MDIFEIHLVCSFIQEQNRNRTMDEDERIATNTKIIILKEEVERLKDLLLQKNEQIKVLQAQNLHMRNACISTLPR